MTYNQHPVGEKSDDTESLAYLQIIFSFTSSLNRMKVECDQVRYEATNRRCQEREIIIAEQNTNEGGTDQTEDLNPHNTVSVAIQTDLTAAEIGGLECDYQKNHQC